MIPGNNPEDSQYSKKALYEDKEVLTSLEEPQEKSSDSDSGERLYACNAYSNCAPREHQEGNPSRGRKLLQQIVGRDFCKPGNE